MRSALPLLLFVSTAALAQTAGHDWDSAKTANAAMRDADEIRARKVFEQAHKGLHTPAFRTAVAGELQPGKFPELGATWGEFITAQETEYIALQLAPPAGFSEKRAIAFGQVVDANGNVVYDFEEPVDIASSKGEPYIERTLILPTSNVVGTFGLAVGGKIVALGRTPMAGEALTGTTAGISRLIVSNNVFNLTKLQSPFEPFAFGGTKVVPKPDHSFRKSDEVWLFTELRNPAVDAGQAPRVTTKIEIEGNGKRVSSPPQTVDASPLKGVRGHYGVGTTIDLSSLKAGDYKVRFTVRDTIANQSYQREETIHLLD